MPDVEPVFQNVKRVIAERDPSTGLLREAREASPGPERAERKQTVATAVGSCERGAAGEPGRGARPSGHLAQGLCCTSEDSQQEFQEKPFGSHHLTANAQADIIYVTEGHGI